MKEHKIYVLFGNDLKVRYVGRTSKSLDERLKQHVKESFLVRDSGTHKKNWLQSVLKKGDCPQIRCIFSSDNYDEICELEQSLISRYRKSHKLVNDVTGPVIGSKRKPVHIYSYEGLYLYKVDSIKDANKRTGVSMSTIDRCLMGEYKYAKGYQFSYEKKEMPNLTDYSTGSSVPIVLIDTKTEDRLFFPSAKLCRERMELDFVGTSAKHIRGAINKKYGDRYRVFIDGKEKTSTYYNTGVRILDDNGEHFFDNQKILKEKMGIIAGTTRKQVIKYINQHFKNVSKIQFNCSLVK